LGVRKRRAKAASGAFREECAARDWSRPPGPHENSKYCFQNLLRKKRFQKSGVKKIALEFGVKNMGSKTLNFKETVSRMVIFKSMISGARFLPENFRRGMLSVVSVGTAQAARVPQWIHFFLEPVSVWAGFWACFLERGW
jgi:hypothetical protein